MNRLIILLLLSLSLFSNAQTSRNAAAYQWWTNGTVSPSPPVNPLETGNAFFFAPHMTSTMFQEGGSTSGTPVTPSTSNSNPVGLMYDIGNNGMVMRTAGANTIFPVLGSDATVNSFLTFDGTDDRLVVQNSTAFFNPIHTTTPIFSMYFAVKMNGGDAGTHRIISSANGNTQIGFEVSRNTSNKLVLTANYGSALNSWTVTSTNNVAVATGWVKIIVSVNGQGASAGRFIMLNGATGTTIEDKTFAVSANGVTTNSPNNLFIGTRPSALQFFNGSLGSFIIKPTVTNQTLIDAYTIYNPTRTSTEFTPVVTCTYDLSDNSYVYSDQAGTTPATNGNTVLLLKNKVSSTFGDTRRNATDASGGPAYNTNAVKTYGGLNFTSGNNLTFQSTKFEALGGKGGFIMVALNRDPNFGSHIWSADNFSTAGDYVVVTGSAYASAGPGLINPYLVVHPNPSGSTNVAINLDYPGVDGIKIFAFQRDGSNLYAWNESGTMVQSTSTQPLSFLVMGRDNFAGSSWDMDGFYYYTLEWNGIYSSPQIVSMINNLISKYK